MALLSVMQVLKASETDWALPHLEGFCGRVMVYQHPGKPIREYTDESWAHRAGLALQILHIIETFVVSVKRKKKRFGNFFLLFQNLPAPFSCRAAERGPA